MRSLVCLVVSLSLTVSAVALAAGPSYAADPVRTLVVSATDGASMYPDFAPDVPRYGVTTTDQTAGRLVVTATTDDPQGEVFVNGRRVTGPTTVTGLADGDEVSVIYDDAGGRDAHSLVYLPPDFPELEATYGAGDVQPGVIGLTLSGWGFPGARSPNFETVVDRNGVPIHVLETASTSNGLDLKRQPDGQLSVSRPVGAGGQYRTVMLDDAFRPTGDQYSTVGLVNTDGHDSEVFPDGSRVMIAYESNSSTGKVDSVIQRISPAGAVTWQWDSSDFVSEAVSPPSDPDYAHVNSIQTVGDDDVIASFRHLSSVYRIASKAHDGYAAGDVIWKLGGRDSTFEFVDDPWGGPCAQHTAYEVAPDRIVLFDNRTDGYCVDPADPDGPTTNEGTSRVVEYELDADAGTATLVWSYGPSGYNAFFAGSSLRLDNGNTLIGWSAEQSEIATEVDGSTAVWSLVDASNPDNQRYFTYRAMLFDLDDIQDPTVRVTRPSQGATYTQGTNVLADFSCTDRGGSNLVACQGSRASGAALDTSTPGQKTFTVTAKDDAGNTTEVKRTYTVAAPAFYRPDAQARASSTAPWRGANVYAGTPTAARNVPRRGQTVTTWLAAQNDGNRTDTFRLKATPGNAYFRVRYWTGGRDVTAAVTAGTLRRAVAQRGTVVLRAIVTRKQNAAPGRARTLVLRAVSAASGKADQAAVTVRATRPQ